MKNFDVRQASGDATNGFIAFLNGKKIEDNPHNKEIPYKDWCAGWRNAKDATKEQIIYFKWIYSIND